MLSGDTLATTLYAIATGYRDRAKNVLYECGELEDDQREQLMAVVWDESVPAADVARRLGDALRQMQADPALVNECYRLAFYLTSASAELATGNPLYADFLAHRSGRLIDKWVHYFAIYDRHLRPFRGRAPRLLEIGVYQGGSLDMWERYFGPGAVLVGVDIDEAAARFAGPDRTIVIGDQADPEFLASVIRRHGPFDIVIDDGGHAMDQQITSIETIFPSVNDGGVYIVEDCHTSYWDEFGGGRRREGTFIEWVKERVDDLHGYHQPVPVNDVWTDHVDAIHCYDSVVVLDKCRRTAPFNEQMGGSEFVFNPRPMSVVVGEMLATRDAAIEQRRAAVDELAHVRATIEEEFRLARGELAEVKPRAIDLEDEVKRMAVELTIMRNDLLEAWDQVRALRHTLSWRITAPLRIFRRRMGKR